MTAKDLAKRALLRAGRTSPGERVLGFYAGHGLPEAAPGPDDVGAADGDGAQPEEVEADEAPPEETEVAAFRELVAEHEVLQELWDRYQGALPPPTYDDLTEQPGDDLVPPLDRSDVDPAGLTDDQRHWWEHGYLLKERFVPDDVLDAYWEVRARLDRPGGWDYNTPYMDVPEVLDLSVHRPLMDTLEELIGEPMSVNLNLTGIVSTERNWHQDDYLNAPLVSGWYAAVWFAVGDIDPDSGPFQFVPGSHRWPLLRRDRVRLYLTPEERADKNWPGRTERFLNELLEAEIARRGVKVETFIGKKGDVLIWHARLMHRGSLPRVPGTIRRSFIAHYTGLSHWALGPQVGHHRDGGMYFLG